jgi:hypothetical protein
VLCASFEGNIRAFGQRLEVYQPRSNLPSVVAIILRREKAYSSQKELLPKRAAIKTRNKKLPGKTSNAFVQSHQDVGFTSSFFISDSSICSWFFLTKSFT